MPNTSHPSTQHGGSARRRRSPTEILQPHGTIDHGVTALPRRRTVCSLRTNRKANPAESAYMDTATQQNPLGKKNAPSRQHTATSKPNLEPEACRACGDAWPFRRKGRILCGHPTCVRVHTAGLAMSEITPHMPHPGIIRTTEESETQ